LNISILSSAKVIVKKFIQFLSITKAADDLGEDDEDEFIIGLMKFDLV
jgi:hypothetical protein